MTPKMMQTNLILVTLSGLAFGHPLSAHDDRTTSAEFCFESAQCSDALYLTEVSQTDADACALSCSQTNLCEFFTFYPDSDNRCVLFAGECDNPSNTDCNGPCYSGDDDCQAVPCFEATQCEGEFLSQSTKGSERACLQDCQASSECVFFNFKPSDGACILLRDCPFVSDNVCSAGDGCTRGHRLCDAEQANPGETTTATPGGQALTKIMVFGGYDGSYLDSVEVIDLEDPNGGCTKRPTPFPSRGQYVALVDKSGKQVVQMCGGFQEKINANIVDTCYHYDPVEDTWTMLEDRSDLRGVRGYGASATVAGDWVVTGGYYEYSTTEFLPNSNGGGVFQPGPTMPAEMTDHCIAQMGDDNRLMFVGFGDSGLTTILDWTSKAFTPAGFTNSPRDSAACGFVLDSDGQPKVVVMSSETSEIYDVSTGVWSAGPTLNNVGKRMGSAQLEDTFVVVGGEGLSPAGYLNTLYMYDTSGPQPIFTELAPKLSVPRSYAVSLAVPRDFVKCP